MLVKSFIFFLGFRELFSEKLVLSFEFLNNGRALVYFISDLLLDLLDIVFQQGSLVA